MLLTRIQNNRRRATRRAAFTLLEVLIVVAILVILGGAASIAYFRYLEDAKVGVLAGSALSAVLGCALLLAFLPRPSRER